MVALDMWRATDLDQHIDYMTESVQRQRLRRGMHRDGKWGSLGRVFRRDRLVLGNIEWRHYTVTGFEQIVIEIIPHE